jgi:hypothetical protein
MQYFNHSWDTSDDDVKASMYAEKEIQTETRCRGRRSSGRSTLSRFSRLGTCARVKIRRRNDFIFTSNPRPTSASSADQSLTPSAQRIMLQTSLNALKARCRICTPGRAARPLPRQELFFDGCRAIMVDALSVARWFICLLLSASRLRLLQDVLKP